MPSQEVIDKVRAWYLEVISKLNQSSPGGRRETVENALTEGVLKDIIERMWDYREANDKRFPQVLLDGSKPSDREVAFNHGLPLPAWGQFAIDEYEGPTGKGFWLHFVVEELDTTRWEARIGWKPGPIGENFDGAKWEEIVEAI